ncbi:hypothetical protein A2U01_0066372, partial [Trifolium medium]|nr:hypothetical protein [Trifolium medium]
KDGIGVSGARSASSSEGWREQSVFLGLSANISER